MQTLLVLGGARSGKSSYAQARAEASCERQVYIATAEALDDEMRDRIQHHQRQRGPSWQTVEEPLALADAIAQHSGADTAVLVDCLTLWLSNVMHRQADVDAEQQALASVVAGIETPLVLVSNEVGMGLVPDNPLGRAFRDEQGRLNRRLAAVCDEVQFVAAGLPLRLKP